MTHAPTYMSAEQTLHTCVSLLDNLVTYLREAGADDLADVFADIEPDLLDRLDLITNGPAS